MPSMKNEIVRRKGFAGGGITDAERAAMAGHANLWINRAMRTSPIDPDKIVPAIEALYSAAGLKAPRVVVVKSPIVMAFAYGAAAAIWATSDATRAATDAATSAATYAATSDAGAASACFQMAGRLGILCAARWASVYQGGNMWSAWDAYLSAARDILGLDLPEHGKYAAWEQASIHGGFRVLHPEFCIVSDFPDILRVDDQNRPHCETGPSHRWRDGWCLYHWHGTSIPSEWIETPASLTAKVALEQTDTNLRIAAIQILGWAKLVDQLGAKVVNRHPEGLLGGELLAVAKSKINARTRGTMKILRAECPRNGIVAFRVPDEITTAHEAQAWKAGLPANIYKLPATRT